MLFVLRAKAAVVGAAVLNLGGKSQGYDAWLVVLQEVDTLLSVGGNQGPEPSMSRASLTHDHPV